MQLPYQPHYYRNERIETMAPVNRKKDIVLFAGVFASTFLLALGAIVGSLMVAPAASNLLASKEPHIPQLPISQVRGSYVETEDSEEDPQPESTPVEADPYPAFPLDPETANEGNRIIIPSINTDVPLVMSPTMEDVDVIQTLQSGAALYPNGILPGRKGNVFIAAHSTGEPWKGAYRFAFLRINELDPGNLIHLDYKGYRYTYEVSGKEVIVPTADFRVISDRPTPTMTLMACWPLWSTEKRMLVEANLQYVTPLPSA